MAELWIPDRARPAFFCRICKKDWPRNERVLYEQHVIRCGEENHDALEEKRRGMREFNEPVDPEWQAYNQALKADGKDPMEQYARGRKSNIRRASES